MLADTILNEVVAGLARDPSLRQPLGDAGVTRAVVQALHTVVSLGDSRHVNTDGGEDRQDAASNSHDGNTGKAAQGGEEADGIQVNGLTQAFRALGNLCFDHDANRVSARHVVGSTT